MSKPTTRCLKRLQAELKALQEDPSSDFSAAPDPNDILIWYFVFDGSPSSPFEGGRYLGKVVFNPDYPMKPPDFYFLTPNGRFSVNTRICISISSFHSENWSPLWNMKNMMASLMAFMNEDHNGVGAEHFSASARKELARRSRTYNVEQLASLYRSALLEEYEKDARIINKESSSTSEILPREEKIATCSSSSKAHNGVLQRILNGLFNVFVFSGVLIILLSLAIQ